MTMRLEKVYLIMDRNYFNNLRVRFGFFLVIKLDSPSPAGFHALLGVCVFINAVVALNRVYRRRRCFFYQRLLGFTSDMHVDTVGLGVAEAEADWLVHPRNLAIAIPIPSSTHHYFEYLIGRNPFPGPYSTKLGISLLFLSDGGISISIFHFTTVRFFALYPAQRIVPLTPSYFHEQGPSEGRKTGRNWEGWAVCLSDSDWRFVVFSA